MGLTPQNLPERVARKKLVEELLDQIGERGFLTMGDLRDAISRNNLKLPDLSEAARFLRGDQLLRADRKLALALDGVYRRGEFYLRWMQRLSSLGFGTRHRPLSDALRRRALRRGVRGPGRRASRVGIDHRRQATAGRTGRPTSRLAQTVAEEGFRLTSPTVVLVAGAVPAVPGQFGRVSPRGRAVLQDFVPGLPRRGDRADPLDRPVSAAATDSPQPAVHPDCSASSSSR